MIRRGKNQGWLTLKVSSLKDWAILNEVDIRNVEFGSLPGLESRGSAIKAQNMTESQFEQLLIKVPKDLILSCDNVHLFAKSDKHLREVLDQMGDFGRTTRGAVLIFLLVQATHSCPEITEKIGTSCAFTDYIKLLPLEELPTFWSDEELERLTGTSLAAALEAKFKSLYREFDNLRRATVHISWCEKYWWHEVDGLLTFDDWKQVDSMYRSRALEFPGIGDAMVPCVDMANHASGQGTVARYESDAEGNGMLLLRSGLRLADGEEITITYGEEKGACEMLFSYGFIEDSLDTARDILLSLDVPDDDPLRKAKKAIARHAPGVRLYDTKDGLRWESDYIWIICVNEEDGLEIELAQTVTGEQELRALWKGQELPQTHDLRSLLQSDELWAVFHLRAISLLQARVEEQLDLLLMHEPVLEQPGSDKSTILNPRRELATRLKKLEFELLERFYDFFEVEKMKLAKTDTVHRYLAKNSEQKDATSEIEDDFS